MAAKVREQRLAPEFRQLLDRLFGQWQDDTGVEFSR
jgi:hypothetical protein